MTDWWDEFRQQMPVAEQWAYFDHAAVAPLSLPAARALTDWADEMLVHGDVHSSELRRRVERDAEASLVPLGGGGAEVGEPFGLRVAVVGRVAGGLAEGIDDVRRRRQIGVADAEGDDIDALGLLRRDLLGDLCEEVGRELLDAVGELHG